MYDKKDLKKYGQNRYASNRRQVEVRSTVGLPRPQRPPRGRTQAKVGVASVSAVIFLILFISAVAVGAFFLGMRTFESKYGVVSQKGDTTDRIVSVESEKNNITEISAAIDTASANSVVVTNEAIQKSGSGFVYDNKGAIITCYHVIQNAKPEQIKVQLNNGAVYSSLDIRGDELSDIAVIMLKDSNGQPLNTAAQQGTIRKTELNKTENIFVIGQTGTEKITAGAALKATVTHNKMRNVNTCKYGEVCDIENIQIRTNDLELYPGLSGGFIADLEGNFAGMIYGMSQDDKNVGYALPVYELTKIVDDLIEKKCVLGRPEMYGVELVQVDVPTEDREYTGLYVGSIKGDKITDTSLEVGDYIKSVGGYDIKTEKDWLEYLKTKKAGSTISMDVIKNGKKYETKATLILKQRAGNDAD